MSWKIKCLLIGLGIRLLIILYGEWHDKYLSVPFTDVDYKVFTDAARHVSEGKSPYERHTYRYPPILAWLLVPNVVFHIWGKILFSAIDVLISILYLCFAKAQKFSDSASVRCVQAWIFNPLAIIISTRGNSDSIISLTVLLSAYFLLKQKPGISGFFLALSVHIRLYPIIFSLPMYLALKPENNFKSIPLRLLDFIKKLYPNKEQIIFVSVSIITFCFLTYFCYYLYGYEYLKESILYHLIRKDTKHNFSVFFYLLYLEPHQPGILLFLSQLILLLVLSIFYGKKSTLLFCLFAQTFVVVTFNPVLTSQYFIWYLSLLIPNYPNFNLSLMEGGKLVAIWLFAQLAWLVPAYLLEFRGKNTFL